MKVPKNSIYCSMIFIFGCYETAAETNSKTEARSDTAQQDSVFEDSQHDTFGLYSDMGMETGIDTGEIVTSDMDTETGIDTGEIDTSVVIIFDDDTTKTDTAAPAICIAHRSSSCCDDTENLCCSPMPPPVCKPVFCPACGDGMLDPRYEACDDGNVLPGDGCSGLCQLEEKAICPTPGEPCMRTMKCGDGKVDPGEVCDDGNILGGDGCNAHCSKIEDGYDCFAPGIKCLCVSSDYCEPDTEVTEPKCRNGIVEPAELCDDGVNDGAYGGCTAECMPGPHCGDGIVQKAYEACDDGRNDNAYNGCGPGCVVHRYCGDGKIDPPYEDCDDGNDIPNDNCDNACHCSFSN